MNLSLRRIEKTDIRSDFDCGEIRVNTYLRQEASQHDKSRNLNCWVLVDPEKKILAFMSLKIESVDFSEGKALLPSSVRRGLSREADVTMVLLAWLGVDLSMKGRGVAKDLLTDILRKILALDQTLSPCLGIVTDPLNRQSRSYFLSQGFLELPGTDRLVLLVNK